MSDIIIPTWEDFKNIVSNATTKLTICSPYYTERGVEKILDSLGENISLSFTTRLSPSDWANNISDPEALLILLDLLENGGHDVILQIHQRLHAKVYIADTTMALIGSSNLTEGGFERNFELMVWLQGEEAKKAYDILYENLVSDSRPLKIDQLRLWVENNLDSIKGVRRKKDAFEAEELGKAQKELDELLGYGHDAPKIDEPMVSDLTSFVSWLKLNHGESGAKVLLARHDNSDNQNLTGHFRQCFYAVFRFIRERPNFLQILSESCDTLAPDDIYQLSQEVSEHWIEHIDAHATDSGEGYSYSVLRGILPPSLGGTRLGGGGGSSTLKRMLPLVSKFILEN